MATYADDKYIQDILVLNHVVKLAEISHIYTNKKPTILGRHFLVGAGGVEPPQSMTTDLQSAPALRLRRAPETFTTICGASSGNRTRISSLEGLHSSP